MKDFIMNGCPTGDVASRLLNCNFDVATLRPMLHDDGRSYLSLNQGGVLKNVMIQNDAATLRPYDWKQIDDAIIKVAMPRLKLVGDLRAAGLSYSIPNGMGKTVLQTENMSDIGDASVSMDGMRENANDRPLFDLQNLPLPIIHKDFSFSARQIQASRNGGSPLDTTMAELAGRKVAEEAEKMAIGVSNNDLYKYAGGTIYGITDYLYRLTQVLTSPEASGWNGETLLAEVLEMKATAFASNHYGPYVLYVSPNWDKYIDNDFKSMGTISIRKRLKEIDGLTDIKTLDYMTGYDMALVQMTSDVIRVVIGMDIVTVEWDSHGGMLKNFKVMAIMVPQLRADYNEQTGIVHGAVVP